MGDSYAGINPKGEIDFQLEELGEWNITGQFGQQTESQTIFVSNPEQEISVMLTFNESVLYVVSPSGATITVSNGSEIITALSSGFNAFTIYTPGEWTISGELDGYNLTSSTVYVQPGNSYQVQLKIMSATLNVNGPENMLVTVQGPNFNKSQTIVGGKTSFSITVLGEYTVTGVLNGFNATPRIISVAGYQNYSVSLTIEKINIFISAPSGTAVKLQNGTEILTGTVQGTQISFSTQTMGTWNVSGSLDGYSLSTATIVVSEYGNYYVSLEILTATLTVNAPAGTSVTVQGGGEEQNLIATNGTVSFDITELGNYLVFGVLNGISTNTQTVDIAEFQTYYVTIELPDINVDLTVYGPIGTEVTVTNWNTTYSGTIIYTPISNPILQDEQTGNYYEVATENGILTLYQNSEENAQIVVMKDIGTGISYQLIVDGGVLKIEETSQDDFDEVILLDTQNQQEYQLIIESRILSLVQQ